MGSLSKLPGFLPLFPLPLEEDVAGPRCLAASFRPREGVFSWDDPSGEEATWGTGLNAGIVFTTFLLILW